jgi:hypothetical protein
VSRVTVPLLVFALVGAPYAEAQVAARPVLNGTVLVGDELIQSGTVTLHHLSADGEGEIDSTAVGPDGSFSLRLPNVPDPTRQDIFFASIRHHGVFYFGNPISLAIQLDSAYQIQAYDTVMAPADGFAFPVENRNVFFEPEGARWRVTELFQLVNQGDKTVVAREGGVTWRHPLIEGATDFTVSQSDIAPDVTTFESGDVVLRAPVTPGERVVVVRYMTDDLFVEIPTPGPTPAMDLLIREPAPTLDVEGLTFVEATELEAGTTYLHFNGANLQVPMLRIVPAEEPFEPPVEWAALVLALLLAGAAMMALKGRDRKPAAEESAKSRAELLLAVAQLDEAFERAGSANPSETAQYRRRRTELLQRIKEAG